MPPNNPFIAVLEQEITLMLFVAIAWAYVQYHGPSRSVQLIVHLSQLGVSWSLSFESGTPQRRSLCAAGHSRDRHVH